MSLVSLRPRIAALDPRPGELWLVAVSGGADSVFLLRSLARLAPEWDVRLCVAHLDHGLRGEESREDARFVERLAAELGIPMRVEALAPGSLGTRGRSPEEQAREARHAFLERVRGELGARRIVLAHHADDQAETVLLNFLRGTGPAGLAGMPEVSSDGGRLFRPLLGLSRQQIHVALRAHGWPHREDSSNRDLSRPRNLIRHRLLPILEAGFNPSVRSSLAEGTAIFRQWVDMVSGPAETALREALREPGTAILALDCRSLSKYTEVVRKFAFSKALRGIDGFGGLSRAHLDSLEGLLASNRGGRRVSLPNQLEAAREGERLVVYRVEDRPPFEALPLAIPGEMRLDGILQLSARRVHPSPEDPAPRPDRVWLDPAQVQGSLEVRRRRPGDRFEPWGLQAETKLKDYLIGARVPRRLRQRLWLLSDSRSVLWVLQLRPSERLRLRTTPEEVIEVRIEPSRLPGLV